MNFHKYECEKCGGYYLIPGRQFSFDKMFTEEKLRKYMLINVTISYSSIIQDEIYIRKPKPKTFFQKLDRFFNGYKGELLLTHHEWRDVMPKPMCKMEICAACSHIHNPYDQYVDYIAKALRLAEKIL